MTKENYGGNKIHRVLLTKGEINHDRKTRTYRSW
jgi:hypothetical protein